MRVARGRELAAAWQGRRKAQLPPIPSGTRAGGHRGCRCFKGAPNSSAEMSFSPPYSCSFSLVHLFGPGNHLPSTIRVKLGLSVDDSDTGRNWWVSSLFWCSLVLRLSRLARTRRPRCGEDLYLRLPRRRLRRRIGFLGSGFLAVLILCD